jgi:hypothetical protein
MAVVKSVRKTSVKQSLERLVERGNVNDSIEVPFRDSEYNTVLKARRVFQEKNPSYRFSTTKDSKNERTIITRIQ